MITLKDLTPQGFPSIVFMPGDIRNEMLKYLREAGIKYDLINNQDAYMEKYRSECKWAAKWYKEAGYPYENPNTIAAVIVKVNPKELIAKSLLFFGETMDPDYKREKEENERLTNQDMNNYIKQATDKEPYIPVHTSK